MSEKFQRTEAGAAVNTDNAALEAYRRQKALRKTQDDRIKALEERVEALEKRLLLSGSFGNISK